MSPRARRRLVHAGALALGTTLVLAGAGLRWGATREVMSLTLAFLALGGLVVVLSLGTWRLLRGTPGPVSFDLRRDLGLWAALMALAHTAVGLTVHFRGRMHLYFLAPEGQRWPGPVRLDAFGAANHLGAVALGLLLMLTLISNDRSLARFGTRRWKALQRLAYPAVGIGVLHGVLYQVLEDRTARLVLLMLLLTAIGVAAQVAGMWLRRRTRRRG